MKTLDDAWRWYEDTKALLLLVDRLAKKHWDHLDWELEAAPEDEGAKQGYRGFARDERFRDYTGDALAAKAGAGLAPLDDLAILVLFSAFESLVRDRVVSEVERERDAVRHPAARDAIETALEQIRDGSFFRVLKPFKAIDADLIEKVNQVRRYRNWVAHGRRGECPSLVTPPMARERIARFLAVLDADPPEAVDAT